MDKPPLLSASRMAILFDVPERSLQRILAQEGVENKRGEGYDFNASVKVVIKHYRLKAESLDSDIAVDRARKAKADAECAEIEVDNRRQLLMLRSDAKAQFADFFAQLRSILEEADYLDEERRQKLIASISAIRLREPDGFEQS